MWFLTLQLAVSFAEATPDRQKVIPPLAAPPTNEAVADLLASAKARLQSLWTKNEGVAVREEQVTLRPWSEQDKRFSKPVRKVDARRIDRRGSTAFVLGGKQVAGRRPQRNSEIVDRDGAVWIVGTVVVGDLDYTCYVRKK